MWLEYNQMDLNFKIHNNFWNYKIKSFYLRDVNFRQDDCKTLLKFN
jgi:hypothetical protein